MENNLIYETSNKKKDKTYDFQQFETIRYFERKTYNNDLSLNDAHELQIRLKDDIDILKESTKKKRTSQKRKIAVTLKNAIRLLNGRKMFLILLKIEYFEKKNKEKDLKVFQTSQLAQLRYQTVRSLAIGSYNINSKLMIQRLPIAIAQVKAGNRSENLLNEITQIIYSVHRAK